MNSSRTNNAENTDLGALATTNVSLVISNTICASNIAIS